MRLGLAKNSTIVQKEKGLKICELLKNCQVSDKF
jgi:hypothetical protein